jgi:peptidoglycan L-alanyl-D-glutamate endopeptidase CwlK
MPSYGKQSAQRLSTCDERLRKLFNEVILHYDCSILCGHRGEAEQNEAYEKGASKKQFPDSKHNKFPSLAIDAVPYPIDWADMERFRHFQGFVEATAIQMGIKIRSGGDWDSDRDFKDQHLIDMPHFELIE